MRRPQRRGPRGMTAIGLVAGILALALSIGPTTPVAAQDVSPTAVIPPLPDELDAVTSSVSPIVWQACSSVGLAVGLVVVAGTLVGVPADVTVPLNDLVALASGPVLALFFEICQAIPLPDEAPTCAFDQQIPPLPSLGRPVLLAGVLANELRALDTALSGLGAPLNGALGRAADDLLACVQGQDPPKDPAPEADVDGAAPTPELPMDPLVSAPRGPASVPPLPALGAVSVADPPALGDSAALATTPAGVVDASDGAGLAFSLLGVAVLAGLAWVHAGNRRSRADRAH